MKDRLKISRNTDNKNHHLLLLLTLICFLCPMLCTCHSNTHVQTTPSDIATGTAHVEHGVWVRWSSPTDRSQAGTDRSVHPYRLLSCVSGCVCLYVLSALTPGDRAYAHMRSSPSAREGKAHKTLRDHLQQDRMHVFVFRFISTKQTRTHTQV